MRKSKHTTSELRITGETLVKTGVDAELGYALLELAEYRDQERKLFACSRVDRMALSYADPDILETKVKSELAQMMAEKTIEDGLVSFSQSFDSQTNELIFQGKLTVLKGE